MFLPLPVHSAHYEQIILITILKKRQQRDNTVNIGCPLRKVSIHSLLVLCIEQLYVNYCGLTKKRFNLHLSRGSTACDVSKGPEDNYIPAVYYQKILIYFFCVGSEIPLTIMNRNSMKV